MARTQRTRKIRRRVDLTALARQANHVVAAAVFVFVASILIGSVLAPWLTSAAIWVRRTWGDTGALVLGPLLIDGLKVLLMIAVAFPFGRVTAPRPWVSGTALVLLVYGFWFSFDFVVGEHRVLYGQWRPLLGRGTLLAATIYLVVTLVQRGRKAALESDRRGSSEDDDDEEPTVEAKDGEKSNDNPPKPNEDPSDPDDDDDNDERSVCKQAAMADVSGAER